jgi:hypothetical protein
MKPVFKEVGTALVLIILSSLVTILVAISFLAFREPPRSPINPDIFKTENYQYDPDPETGWVPRPKSILLSRTTVPTFVYTDALGARVDGPDFVTSEQVDLITVGCSQAWGQGIPNEATFTSVLGKQLGWKTANFSVPGYGGVSSLVILRRKLPLKPKVAVYAFWEDHINRNVNRCAETGAPVCLELPVVRQDQSGHPYILSPRNPHQNMQLMRRWFMETAAGTDEYRTLRTDFFWTGFQVFRKVQQTLGRYGMPVDPFTKGRDGLAATEYVLSEMQRVAKENGAKLVVVYIPVYFHSVVKEAPPELVTFSEQRGIRFLSLSRRFNAMKSKGIEIGIPGDTHLSTTAHHAVAEEIAGIL